MMNCIGYSVLNQITICGKGVQVMKTRNKKAFTVVELVIVIAIIAILAAILIPTFASLVKKANVSADEQLIRNLNTALASSRAEHNNKPHSNMFEALEAAEKFGYTVGKINASQTDNEILWDQKNDVFCYLDGDTVRYLPNSVVENEKLSKDDYRLWKIYNDSDIDPTNDTQTYSIYWNRSDTPASSNISVGFDAGRSDKIMLLNYVNTTGTPKKEVIIRTNNGSLTIDAEDDTVRHYGSLEDLTIQSVAIKSYHEYGNVVFVAIKAGHISFESGSSVKALHIIANDQKVFDKIILSYKDGVEQPDYSRDYCVIGDEGTLICTLVLPEETNNIFLFKNGIYEQIKLQPTTLEVEQNSTSSDAKIWITDDETATTKTRIASDQLANRFGNRTSALVEVEGQDKPVFLDNEKNLDSAQQAKVVTEKPSLEEKKEEALASVYVRAQVDHIDLDKLSVLYSLLEYYNITNQAYLDQAYNFKGFTDAEFELMAKFIEAKDSDGNDIFSINNIDISSLSPENIEKALSYVKTEYGEETSAAIEKIINQKTPYFDWMCDFEVSFDRDIEEGSVALAGHYGAFADNYYNGQWLGFGLPNIKATDEPVRLLKTMFEMYNNPDFNMPYIAILAIVQEFGCGVTNLSNDNVGTTITVELCIYDYDDQGKQIDRIVCGTYQYTLGEVSQANLNLINGN